MIFPLLCYLSSNPWQICVFIFFFVVCFLYNERDISSSSRGIYLWMVIIQSIMVCIATIVRRCTLFPMNYYKVLLLRVTFFTYTHFWDTNDWCNIVFLMMFSPVSILEHLPPDDHPRIRRIIILTSIQNGVCTITNTTNGHFTLAFYKLAIITHNIVPYHIIRCHAIPHHYTPYHTTPYHTTPHNTTPEDSLQL